MINQIYLIEFQLNKAITSDTKAPCLGLHLSISNDTISSEIYSERDGFHFDIVNSPFLDGDIPRSPSYIHLSAYSFRLINDVYNLKYSKY